MRALAVALVPLEERDQLGEPSRPRHLVERLAARDPPGVDQVAHVAAAILARLGVARLRRAGLAEAAPDELLFFNLLEKYFDGDADEATLEKISHED